MTIVSSDDWCTPLWLTRLLGEFDLDVCANGWSCVMAARPITKHEDGLLINWDGLSVFCNPPYSNPLPWAKRLAVHTGKWCTLLKLDTSTKWWKTVMMACDDWAPFRDRIKFERPGTISIKPNFCSALIWGGGWLPSPQLKEKLWTRKTRK